mgnify:CR=1 FL=1
MEEEVGTVAKRYSQLESERDTFLERGREAAKLTIPTLMPEEGHSSSLSMLHLIKALEQEV